MKPNKHLSISIKTWFAIAVIGQLIFAYYSAFFYGSAVVEGDLSKWNNVLPHGYTDGEFWPNFTTGTHILFAVIALIGGPLQFIPQIRNKFKRFHRINGRIYITSAVLLGLGGIIMTWLFDAGAPGSIKKIAATTNGLLILIFSFITVKLAIKRSISNHQNWAFRLFLVMNGIWFFRVYLMFWIAINGGPVGFDPVNFTGPVLDILNIAQFAVPLAVYEVYLYIKKCNQTAKTIALTIFMWLVNTSMAFGILVAFKGLWLPHL